MGVMPEKTFFVKRVTCFWTKKVHFLICSQFAEALCKLTISNIDNDYYILINQISC